ncbi:MAG: CCA tRNA nucleotidyltransferase [Clostridia bacterium]|nr:CCA tRNA nucleotidyltransferase [Clostridia bacterium]
MRTILPENLIDLANTCDAPLYVVGGFVRDYLAHLTPIASPRDIDICAPLSPEKFVQAAQKCGFSVQAVYKTTGTVKCSDGAGNDYEFSCFRSDKYVRGVHTPVEIFFTDDITLDAKRRDFTANAVYYDIAADCFVDPLDGISAVKEKRFTTVAPAQKVFGEDGLRLMRLARQAAQLGFSPDTECLAGATENASLIKDITPERIFTELSAILYADQKYGVEYGQYEGLTLLDKTRVLDYILPELTLGRGMTQRADFHKYDVLEHSLHAVKYADKRIRFAALLHDVGKPFCIIRDGNSFDHPSEGERLTTEILTRLKAPKKTVSLTASLVKWHMYDFNCQTSENKLRRFFAQHYALLEDLLLVKQADFSACMDKQTPAPTVVKWQKLLDTLQAEGAPLTLKQLAVTGNDLLGVIPSTRIAEALQKLLLHTVVNPSDNRKERLLKLVHGFVK